MGKTREKYSSRFSNSLGPLLDHAPSSSPFWPKVIPTEFLFQPADCRRILRGQALVAKVVVIPSRTCGSLDSRQSTHTVFRASSQRRGRHALTVWTVGNLHC